MFKKTLMTLFVLLLIIPLYLFTVLNKMEHVKIAKSNEALGIRDGFRRHNSSNSYLRQNVRWETDQIQNIAFFGLDLKGPENYNRSDSILIVTIDHLRKKIKLSSIMRDLKLPIEEYGMDKINHAYHFGGPQLAIKTLNQNFDTNIQDFIAVDIIALEQAINILGGVPIDIQEGEISFINESIRNERHFVKKSGFQLLNGEQAVAYARVRMVGNGDFERTQRQRKILSELYTTIHSKGLTAYPNYVNQILPLTKTSMNKYQILSLGIGCIKDGTYTLEEGRFPIDGYWKNENSEGIYYLVSDLTITKKHILDYIYRDIHPSPPPGKP